MTLKEYSDFLIPNVEHDYLYYEKKYPERNLKEGAMVTRFAPSPTGFVHMGSLYTSFSDLQLAKQTNGIAYLRIEDTDQKREVENGIEGIIKDFESLGISWDEGPIYGGNYGPYVQSERKDIYRAYAKKLIEESLAYPCFCSAEDLKEIREIQELNKERIGYYGTWAKCRNIPMEEAIRRIEANEKYIIRLKSQGNFNNKIILEDCIKGNIEMPENDMDIVIIKSDGLPTYHFAHAIDDHLMHTTHVIRGDEWVSSYPIHHELFNLLGFKRPKYAHIAPITIRENETVRKLSKRKDKEAAISYYYNLGIPTEVIRLYLATVNNSSFEEWYTENPKLTIDDYNFTFDKMPVGGSLFDINKLISISKIYFGNLSKEQLYEGLIKYTKSFDKEFFDILTNNKEYALNVLNIEREKPNPRKDISCYKDVKELNWYMFDKLYAEHEKTYEFMKINDIEEIKNILKTYIEKYIDLETDQNTWFDKIKSLAEELGYAKEVKLFKKNPDEYKGHVGDVATVLRVVLTTKNQTPDLYEIMKVLSKEEVIKRYENFIKNN